jgi:cysteine synthase A
MIQNAEKEKRLVPHSGQTIVEPTGGNTGTGLAILGVPRGYRVLLVVPDNYVSKQRLDLLRLRGAEVMLSDHREGNDSHIRLVERLCRENPKYVWLNQFENPANSQVHFEKNGMELVNQVDKLDVFLTGIGSGGTMTGVGRRLRRTWPRIALIGVQPDGCDVKRGHAIPHRIQGWAVGLLPKIFDHSLVDCYVSVSYEQAVETLIGLAKHEGLLVGLSAAANVSAALAIARTEFREHAIATIAPDGGRNYPDYVSEWLSVLDQGRS